MVFAPLGTKSRRRANGPALFLALLAVALLCGGAAAEAQRSIHADRALDRLTATHLERFESEQDFERYVRAARRAAEERDFRGAYALRHQYAQAETEPCPPDRICPEASKKGEEIVVTGSRIPAAPVTITNTQEGGVDEGDIVKQFGQFLIVLQDGRLFVADMRPGGAPGLALIDRANVYRHEKEDTWYDEMLVQENRIVVTGYSYDENATEITVFTISEAGRLTREGAYFMSSHDYYDTDNYSTRLVGDKLIFYSPLDLEDIDPDEPVGWPLVRRLLRREEAQNVLSRGRRVFDARDIYRPILRTVDPTIHTVSICPLGRLGPGDELDCSSAGFAGPEMYAYYVSPKHAYLWMGQGYDELQHDWDGRRCEAGAITSFGDTQRSALVQIPLNGGPARALMTRGMPWDQFSMQVSERVFRALIAWIPASCEPDDEQLVPVKYFSVSLSALGEAPVLASMHRYVDAPALDVNYLENRFTDSFVVYGGHTAYEYDAPEAGEAPKTSRVVAIPVADPRSAATMQAPHNVIRLERVGDNIALTGYRDDRGLSISLVDLRSAPRLAPSVLLEGRYESEGRSHAFNSVAEPDGSGLLGVPTVRRAADSDRWAWRSRPSDVSFLAFNPAAELSSLGELSAREEAEDPSYKCEVSCVDWYGNSRPIFTEGRVFALSATELIEGEIADGRIGEVRRLNLTEPLATDRRARIEWGWRTQWRGWHLHLYDKRIDRPSAFGEGFGEGKARWRNGRGASSWKQAP